MSNETYGRQPSGRRALALAPLVFLFIQCGALDERNLNEASGGSSGQGGGSDSGSGGVVSGGRGGSSGSGGTATGSAPGTSGGSSGSGGAGKSSGGAGGSTAGVGGSVTGGTGGTSSGGVSGGDSGAPGAGAGGVSGGDSGGSAGAGGDPTPGGGDGGAGAGGCSASDCGTPCASNQKLCGSTCIAASACCSSGDCPATATCNASNACVCNAGYFGKACNYYFKALGFGASTHNEGQVNGVSADGNVPVGWSRGPTTSQLAVRWVQEVGRLLPALQDAEGAMATAVNADGSVIVGDASVLTGSTTTEIAFRFANNATTPLPLLQFGTYNHATAVNANGTIIVGWGDNDTEFRGIRWTNGVAASLSSVDSITPLALSSDGTILLGVQGSVSGGGPLGTVRYASIGGSAMRFTTTFAPLDGGGVATASSSNGNIAAGYTGANATRWTGTTAQNLGAGAAYAISGDGSIVVGTANNLAMIWDATNGARSLPTVLTQAGVDLTGWTLRQATGISSNGKVIVGNGQHGSATEPWLVRLP